MTPNNKGEIRIIPILMSLILATTVVGAFGIFLSEGADQTNQEYNNTVLENIANQRNQTINNIEETRDDLTGINPNSNVIGQIIDIATLIFGGAWRSLQTLYGSFATIFSIITFGVTSLPLGFFGVQVIDLLTTFAVLSLLAVLFRASLKTNI